MSALGYSLAQEDEAPNILLCDVPELLAALPLHPQALKGKLISSLAVLATSLLPLRETNLHCRCNYCILFRLCRDK